MTALTVASHIGCPSGQNAVHFLDSMLCVSLGLTHDIHQSQTRGNGGQEVVAGWLWGLGVQLQEIKVYISDCQCRSKHFLFSVQIDWCKCYTVLISGKLQVLKVAKGIITKAP